MRSDRTGVAVSARPSFARDVREGLTATPKRLPCRWFYDAEGSTLFDAICDLPEYYLTRAEREILLAHAGSIVARLPVDPVLVELGCGSATKTRLLIDALIARDGALRYVPIDISESALAGSAHALASAYRTLDVAAVVGEYDEAPAVIDAERTPRVVLWLGSSVGNLDREQAASFLRRIRAVLAPTDRLLMGVDLRKDAAVLESAYDDAQRVTARFNLNLLARINRELGGRFDVDQFAHRAVYEVGPGRIAMYLVSRRAQRVRIDALDLDVSFEAGEAIHTEDSWKYSEDEIAELARRAAFVVEARWLDPGGRFSENLLVPFGMS